ncbi:hypothetical protein [Actinoplanes lutulentus]|uniref:hypothetical protein n=1 Tax=Actinoplanes lutulentus TaxID=1287878 RepID=UPI000DBA747D
MMASHSTALVTAIITVGTGRMATPERVVRPEVGDLTDQLTAVRHAYQHSRYVWASESLSRLLVDAFSTPQILG